MSVDVCDRHVAEAHVHGDFRIDGGLEALLDDALVFLRGEGNAAAEQKYDEDFAVVFMIGAPVTVAATAFPAKWTAGRRTPPADNAARAGAVR
ncbi:MAG: hypothetical protein MZV70_07135 [Desulfobacterales bacterium]|nr:hypothetical protein [Desulfobacterales bacterium]